MTIAVTRRGVIIGAAAAAFPTMPRHAGAHSVAVCDLDAKRLKPV